MTGPNKYRMHKESLKVHNRAMELYDWYDIGGLKGTKGSRHYLDLAFEREREAYHLVPFEYELQKSIYCRSACCMALEAGRAYEVYDLAGRRMEEYGNAVFPLREEIQEVLEKAIKAGGPFFSLEV